MLFLRIKQAEVAFAGNRIDEAYDLVIRPDVRAHRRGQDLAGKLTTALLKRAQRWLDDDRPADAAIDADKAIRLAGHLPEAVQLKARASAAMLDSQLRHRQSAEALARARMHLNQGRPGFARELVQHGNFSTGGLQVIMQDLNDHNARANASLQRAELALARSDFDAAIAELLAVQKLDAANPRAAELIDQLHRDLISQATAALEDGRLDLAGLLESRLIRLAPGAIDVESFRQHLNQLRTAWDAIDRGQLRRADEILKRMTTTLPACKWLLVAAERLHSAAEAVETVRTGPLGLLPVRSGPHAETLPPPGTPAMSARITPPPLPSQHRPPLLLNRMMLQVDGAGSFVVVRDPAVSIGPISSTGRVQIGLVCEPNTPTAHVERVEDDYFLRANSGVSVNETPTASKLLNAGDRIGLSPRCRMQFFLPVPASTTAVLELTGARHPRSDVRRIILMDRELVIAPGGGSHIRLDSLSDALVLTQRDGQLFLRGGTAVTMADQPIDENTPLQPHQPIRGAGFGFVITPA